MSEPSTAQPQHRYTYHLIIPHAEEPRLLLQRTGEGWALPSFEPQTKYLARVGQNNAWSREHLGLECVTLYVAHVEDRRKELGRVDATYVLQARNRDWSTTDGLQWAGREELAGLEPGFAGQLAVVEAWLDEREGRIEPPQRGAWNAPGWYEEASRWTREQLELHGIEMVAPPEQFKHWIITSALRVPTNRGDYYFKAVPALFAQEPRITAALASRHPPRLCPRPLPPGPCPARAGCLCPTLKGRCLRKSASSS